MAYVVVCIATRWGSALGVLQRRPYVRCGSKQPSFAFSHSGCNQSWADLAAGLVVVLGVSTMV